MIVFMINLFWAPSLTRTMERLDLRTISLLAFTQKDRQALTAWKSVSHHKFPVLESDSKAEVRDLLRILNDNLFRLVGWLNIFL